MAFRSGGKEGTLDQREQDSGCIVCDWMFLCSLSCSVVGETVGMAGECALKKISKIWLTLRGKLQSLKAEYLYVFAFPKKKKNQALWIIGYLLYAFPSQYSLRIQLASWTVNLLTIPRAVGIPVIFYSVFEEKLR